MSEPVLTEVSDGVAVITVNRPEARNAINGAVAQGIAAAVADLDARDDVRVAMHNHPLYGTVWGDMREIPPAMDQSSSLGGGQLVLVDEYAGSVNSSEAAAKTVAALGDADLALLAGHGVFVLGSTVRAVHQRAVALEQRCRNAWYVRAAGGVLDSPLPAWFSEQFRRSDGDGFRGFWEAMVRAELRAAPTLLGAPES